MTASTWIFVSNMDILRCDVPLLRIVFASPQIWMKFIILHRAVVVLRFQHLCGPLLSNCALSVRKTPKDKRLHTKQTTKTRRDCCFAVMLLNFFFFRKLKQILMSSPAICVIHSTSQWAWLAKHHAMKWCLTENYRALYNKTANKNHCDLLTHQEVYCFSILF